MYRYTRVLKGALFALLFSLSALLPSYAAITADGPGSGVAGPRETAPEEGAQTEALWQDPASPRPLEMEVVYGYDNTARSGRILPMTIRVTNSTKEDFTGTLRAATLEPEYSPYGNSSLSEYGTYRYEYPIEVKAGETVEKKIQISLSIQVDQVLLSLVDQEGKETAGRRIRLDLNLDTAELYVGVLSDHPERLSYMDHMGINYSTLRTRLIELDQDTMPESRQELDQLDVLLINDFDTGSLDSRQLEAVWEWTQSGGTLLFGTGEHANETLGAFSKALLASPLPQAVEFELDMESSQESSEYGDSRIVLNCTEVDLKGSTEVMTKGPMEIISSTPVGRGMAAAAIYDFGDLKEYGTDNPSYVDRLFTELIGENRLNLLSSGNGGSSAGRYWEVQSLINTGNVNRLPKVGLYVTLAVAYVALAGPGLYFFLKQRELRQYYQPAVAILSLCCTGMVLLMGIPTRFNGPFFTYASIQDAGEEDISETLFINMRSPYNHSYGVSLDPSYRLFPVCDSSYYNSGTVPALVDSEDPDMVIRYKEDETYIEARDTGAFNPSYFQMERNLPNETGQGFSGEIRAFEGTITGTITNNYPWTVENAALLLYNQMVMIGTIEPGQTISLDGRELIYCATDLGYAMAAQITGASRYGQKVNIEDPDYVRALERTNLLSFYVENYFSGYHTQARVVAFSQEQKETGFLRNPGTETYGCTLLTSELDVNYEQDGLVSRSAMQKQPHVLAGEYDAARNTIYGINPVVLEYYLGNELEVDTLHFHRLSEGVVANLRYYYTVPFEGNMYFYNYNTGSYDRMDSAVSQYNREELDSYLSPGNTITVKYVYDTAGEYTWNIMLPVLTVTGRRQP